MNTEYEIQATPQPQPDNLDEIIRKDRVHAQRLREIGVRPAQRSGQGTLDSKPRDWERRARKARKAANASKRLQRNVARKAYKLHQKSKQSKGKQS